jgi:type IX secretion system PorP/SprF family membrane protein
MRKILFIISFLSVCGFSKAQQFAQYTQVPYHQFSLNPALAGIEKCLDFRMLYRMQWVHFPGAPNGGFLTVSARIKPKRRRYKAPTHGIGGRILYDQIGPFTKTKVELAYAIHMRLNKDIRLSLGAYAGIFLFSFGQNGLIAQQADPTIAKAVTNKIYPDASFGAWLDGSKFYAGFTAQQLFGSTWREVGSNSKFKIHFTLNGGYKWKFHKNLSLIPSVLLKIPTSGPWAMDLNLMLDYKNVFSFAVGYRNIDAVTAMFRVRFLKYVTVAYSFDFITSKINNGIAHTHEISLGISTCRKKSPKPTDCPAFE